MGGGAKEMRKRAEKLGVAAKKAVEKGGSAQGSPTGRAGPPDPKK